MLHVYFTKRQSVKSKNKSFTLLEIVFTITIIGILLAICLPVMSAIKLSAQKLKDASNLQTIAAAWKEYTINRGNIMNLMVASPGTSCSDYGNWFAQTLAGVEQNTSSKCRFYPSKCALNGPNVYISSNDRYASKVLKEYIAIGIDTNEGCETKEYNPWSVSSATDLKFVNPPWKTIFSYCTIGNLDGSVPLATTPLAFTRGLKSDGTWDEKYGLYGSKGGYVVFCDGHITWFDGNKPAKFLHWSGEEYTTDIRQAVPNVAKIGNGGITGTEGTKYSNLIVWGNGTGGN
ncbi:MAG: type II secretion system GspH family protein [Puniceicoccales bacterium]|nr:type II secretion system GspH family protein [Puniceicoccales bacterium]